jgi:hypothetical protein
MDPYRYIVTLSNGIAMQGLEPPACVPIIRRIRVMPVSFRIVGKPEVIRD